MGVCLSGGNDNPVLERRCGEDLISVAWFGSNSGGRTHAVGELKANPFGLLDVHGNVWEWVQDGWDPAFYGKSEGKPAINPSSPFSANSQRVLRGGGFVYGLSACRSSLRYFNQAWPRGENVGFRVVLPADGVKQLLSEKQAPPSTKQGSTWHGWPADAPAPAIAPFDAEQAAQHQQVWADYLGVPVEYENSIGMKFRLIPPGEFLMGSTPKEIVAELEEAGDDERWRERIQSEEPRHKVVLTQPVYVGATEVTQSQYEEVMSVNPSYFSAGGEGKDKVAGLETGLHPVEKVSWNDAAEFCAKLSQHEKLKPFYFRSGITATPLDGIGYRLPTEAEWESACRAGTSTRLWSGDQDQDLIQAGWFGSNSAERTHSVGELSANPFGLFDTHGNVWEWVQDGWDQEFYGKSPQRTAIDPSSPFTASADRVFRGDSFLNRPSFCRSSARNAAGPLTGYRYVGFRVLLPVHTVKQLLTKKVAPPQANPGSSWHGWPVDTPAPALAPFDTQQAAEHQQAWADYLGVPVEYENSIGMKFRLIPPGEFLMGSTADEIDSALPRKKSDELQVFVRSEGPRHRVILTRPVYMGETEVTQRQFQKITGQNPSQFSVEGKEKDAVADLETLEFPVERVSWHDAVAFCVKLGEQDRSRSTDEQPDAGTVFSGSSSYRLPTEAEWEFACRAGTMTPYSNGDSDRQLASLGWFAANADGRTHAVGELQPNPLGLFDMHGNVWEWVQDAWTPGFYETFSEQPAIDSRCSVQNDSRYITRGGDWRSNPSYCRSATRFAAAADHHYGTGFRVVLEIDRQTGGDGKPK